MTTLLEIKAAIDRLSPRDYCELMAMLHPAADDDWDRQIAADLAAGRLDGLIADQPPRASSTHVVGSLSQGNSGGA